MSILLGKNMLQIKTTKKSKYSLSQTSASAF